MQSECYATAAAMVAQTGGGADVIVGVLITAEEPASHLCAAGWMRMTSNLHHKFETTPTFFRKLETDHPPEASLPLSEVALE